jgi:RNA ligase (TIGR02306 family)
MMGLAYVGRVETLNPIVDADRIESATVSCGSGGRWCGVVKKGEFSVGDLATVYLQDAIVPESSGLDFLKASNWRVKMARFRGAPSECVIVRSVMEGYGHGDDLTTALGVVKYEKTMPAQLSGAALGLFPSFIPKTDEINFQTGYRLIEAVRGKPWFATEKLDGSSTTAYRQDNHFGVCSRNLELIESDSGYWRIAHKYRLRELLPDGVALQWETVGPGIQKNPLGLKEIDGFAFDAYLFKERRYCSFVELESLCKEIGFPRAPFVSAGAEFNFDSDQLRRLAEGTYQSGKQREGIVIRPMTPMTAGHDRVSFKVINLLYTD